MTSGLPYLDELDQMLLDQYDECMLMSQLDGFLTGIAVSPELVPPTDWLKHVWCGEDGEGVPEFDDQSDFQRFVDLIMRHYNTILSSLNRPGDYEPVLEIDSRNGDVLWEMWVGGFTRAMDLAPDAWSKIEVSDDAGVQAALTGIRTLSDFFKGTKKLSRKEEDEWDRQAPGLIPIWIEMLHAWRLENDPNRPRPVRRTKVGRNDPCPCGSGKKYKKCCGLN